MYSCRNRDSKCKILRFYIIQIWSYNLNYNSTQSYKFFLTSGKLTNLNHADKTINRYILSIIAFLVGKQVSFSIIR